MARDSKKRSKALQRKAAKRKQKQKQSRLQQIFQPNSRKFLRQAGTWPLYEVLLSEEWQETGAIIQILVARQSPQGHIGVAAFLVDLGCLGIKNAFGRIYETRSEYKELRDGMASGQTMIAADLNLVAKIVQESMAYAQELGFKPDPDYRQAMLVLGDADPEACSVDIPLGGPEGKPFFVAGPYDNVDRVVAKLTKAVGPNGFHYLMPLDVGDGLFSSEDMLDE